MFRLPKFTFPSTTRLRWAAAAGLAVIAFAAPWLWPHAPAYWILFGLVAAACTLLPVLLGAATLGLVVGLHFVFTWVNSVKTGLTGMPLTVLDIKIALANPAGLWNALGLPQWTRLVVTVVMLAAATIWLWIAFATARRFAANRDWRMHVTDTIGRAVAIVVVILLIQVRLQAVYANAAMDNSTWQLEGVTALASRIGILPFLAYSHHLESQSTGDIYRTDVMASAPSREEVRSAVLRYMNFTTDPQAPALSPNILVVLAESTFDPGAIFQLQGKWNDGLFRVDADTAASGLLRVNAMGGGTWITEFETIVGFDSRLFGYSGMYTHASLSPFVERSIATYMREHGYRTWAFFPHGGDFYNARHAYENYGFENVLDSFDLGRGSWMEADRDVAASVQAALGPAPAAPFFGYALLIENHSPHDCVPPGTAGFPVHFSATADFTPNCALHEYLRRLGSTTAAVQSLIAYLAALETQTGRPYVLLVFGDHQPHTFSSTGGFQYDYSAFRKVPDTRMTFFHIWSSLPHNPLRCCESAPPATVLPTLLSRFVTNAPDDIYLGINLWLHARCGSDALHRDFGAFMNKLEDRNTLAGRTSICESAYARALAWYQGSGVVRLSGDSPRNPLH
jgi:hypothetical protein